MDNIKTLMIISNEKIMAQFLNMPDIEGIDIFLADSEEEAIKQQEAIDFDCILRDQEEINLLLAKRRR